MKNKILLPLCLLACVACGAAEDSPEDDAVQLGTVEEALHYQCAPSLSHYYGVDVSDVNWSNYRCDILNSSSACMYPGMKIFGGYTIIPFTLYLGNGWTATDKTELATGGTAAASALSGFLGGSCTHNSAPFAFSTTSTPPSNAYMILDKGTISGSVNTGFNFEDTRDLMHMACTSSTAISEPYTMQSAAHCNSWRATVDYADLKTWATAGGSGTAGLNRGVQNLMQKAFIEGMGIGLDGSSSTDINGIQAHRNIVENTFRNDASSWVCNAAQSETSNVLTCI